MKKIFSGEEVEKKEISSYEYDEILGLKYKLVLNTDYYVKQNNMWVDKSLDEEFMKELLSDALELEVVGIIRLKEDYPSYMGTSGLAYTENLVGDEDLSFLSSDAQYLYNKYIKYYNDVYKIEGSDEISSIETNNFKNININDSSSDEYLIKYSILSILKDNNVDISKYHFDMCIDCSDEDYYKNGYKITTTQIETYIKNNFKLNRKIDFKNTEISFGCTTLISLAYYDEGYYKLVDFTSIPSGGCFGETTYSKVLKEETSGNNLIIYTEFMIYGLAGDMYYLNSFVEENNEYEFILKDSSEKCGEWPEGCFGVYGYEHIKSCILNNYSDKVGKFKHIFTKDSNGNYYWVSTQKIN